LFPAACLAVLQFQPVASIGDHPAERSLFMAPACLKSLALPVLADDAARLPDFQNKDSV
jgi:hypothetical protein